MPQTNLNRLSITESGQDTAYLETWIEAFLLDRKAQNMSGGTLYFYTKKLQLFAAYCSSRAITQVTQITPDDLRRYLLHLEETDHNPGGINACYRAMKTFLLWYEEENQPDNWTNPIKRVKPPKLPIEPLEPVTPEAFECLARACGKDFTGRRDVALLDFLLDTGTRAAEALACNVADVDQVSGSVLVRQGKGRKPRTVYLGKKSRRSLRQYLKLRSDGDPALWVSDEGTRLTYGGLRGILRRLSERAGLPEDVTAHDFRRGFALQCLRDGMNIYALQILMGHADLQVLRRYLRQTEQDTRQAHAAHGPVDNLGKGGRPSTD